MADSSGSHFLLVELSSLDSLLNPIKSASRIRYTCFDVSNRYLACGTTSGALLLFNHDTLEYITTIANKEGPLTRVALGPDDNYAAMATSKGLVMAYCHNQEKRSSQPQKLQCSYEHMGTQVNCLQWNNSCSKLFIGDDHGKITILNVSTYRAKNLFQMATCPLMKVDSAIVQMDFAQDHLLVSTLTKVYLCDTSREQYIQVGRKPREGEFGACFYPGAQNHPSCLIFAARPGSRLWEADMNCNVNKTHQFKQALAIPPTKVISFRTEEVKSTPTPLSPKSELFKNLQLLWPSSNSSPFIFMWSTSGIFIFNPLTSEVILWSDDIIGFKSARIHQNSIYIHSSNSQFYKYSLLPIESAATHFYSYQCYVQCARFLLSNHKSIDLSALPGFVVNQLKTKLLEAGKDELAKEIETLEKTVLPQSMTPEPLKLSSGIYIVNPLRHCKSDDGHFLKENKWRQSPPLRLNSSDSSKSMSSLSSQLIKTSEFLSTQPSQKQQKTANQLQNLNEKLNSKPGQGTALNSTNNFPRSEKNVNAKELVENLSNENLTSKEALKENNLKNNNNIEDHGTDPSFGYTNTNSGAIEGTKPNLLELNNHQNEGVLPKASSEDINQNIPYITCQNTELPTPDNQTQPSSSSEPTSAESQAICDTKENTSEVSESASSPKSPNHCTVHFDALKPESNNTSDEVDSIHQALHLKKIETIKQKLIIPTIIEGVTTDTTLQQIDANTLKQDKNLMRWESNSKINFKLSVNATEGQPNKNKSISLPQLAESQEDKSVNLYSAETPEQVDIDMVLSTMYADSPYSLLSMSMYGGMVLPPGLDIFKGNELTESVMEDIVKIKDNLSMSLAHHTKGMMKAIKGMTTAKTKDMLVLAKQLSSGSKREEDLLDVRPTETSDPNNSLQIPEDEDDVSEDSDMDDQSQVNTDKKLFCQLFTTIDTTKFCECTIQTNQQLRDPAILYNPILLKELLINWLNLFWSLQKTVRNMLECSSNEFVAQSVFPLASYIFIYDPFDFPPQTHALMSELASMCIRLKLWNEVNYFGLECSTPTPLDTGDETVIPILLDSKRLSDPDNDTGYPLASIDQSRQDLQTSIFIQNLFHFLEPAIIREGLLKLGQPCFRSWVMLLKGVTVSSLHNEFSAKFKAHQYLDALRSLENNAWELVTFLAHLLQIFSYFPARCIEVCVERAHQVSPLDVLYITRAAECPQWFLTYVTSVLELHCHREGLLERILTTDEVRWAWLKAYFKQESVDSLKCSCGSPRPLAHKHKWAHNWKTLKPVISSLPTGPATDLCYKYGYWPGFLWLKKGSPYQVAPLIQLADIDLLSTSHPYGYYPEAREAWKNVAQLVSKQLSKPGYLSCLSCNQPHSFDASKVTLTWNSLAHKMLAALGPSETIYLLKSFHLPPNSLSLSFVKSSMLSLLISQKQSGIAQKILTSLENYQWTRRSIVVSPEMYNKIQKLSGKSKESVPLPQRSFLEEPEAHWGISSRLKSPCPECTLPINCGVSGEVTACCCGHLYHKSCLPQGFCTLCQVNN